MKRRQWLATLSAIAAAATGSLGWLWMRKHAGNADRHAIVQAVFSSPLPPLTAQHLQLIRQLRVSWFPIESGAPGIDPLQPLRGPHSSLENAQQILQIQNPPLDFGVCRISHLASRHLHIASRLFTRWATPPLRVSARAPNFAARSPMARNRR